MKILSESNILPRTSSELPGFLRLSFEILASECMPEAPDHAKEAAFSFFRSGFFLYATALLDSESSGGYETAERFMQSTRDFVVEHMEKDSGLDTSEGNGED